MDKTVYSQRLVKILLLTQHGKNYTGSGNYELAVGTFHKIFQEQW